MEGNTRLSGNERLVLLILERSDSFSVLDVGIPSGVSKDNVGLGAP